MRIIISTIITALALVSCNTAGYRSVRLEGGSSHFQKRGVEDQATSAIGYQFQAALPPGNAPVGWVGDVALRGTSIDDTIDGFDLTGNRTELDLGTRYYMDIGSGVIQPFLGFGGTLQHIRLDDGVSRATETMAGYYGVLGVEAPIGDGLRLGVQYRITSNLETRFDGDTEDTDLDAGAVLFTIGWSL